MRSVRILLASFAVGSLVAVAACGGSTSSPRATSACQVISVAQFRSIIGDPKLQAVASKNDGPQADIPNGSMCWLNDTGSLDEGYYIMLSPGAAPKDGWSATFWSVSTGANQYVNARFESIDPTNSRGDLPKNTTIKAAFTTWKPTADNRSAEVLSMTALTADGHTVQLGFPGVPADTSKYYQLLAAAGDNLN
ncbi:MAG: hypothetical protein ACQR33_03520 [Candidatus Saccharibacteria bacterium]